MYCAFERMMDAVLGCNAPFLLHVVVETPASLNFFLFPSDQLGKHTPHAHAIVRQYACLLFASVAISLAFTRRPPDTLSGQVAGAFALYHVAASVRAASRLQRQMKEGKHVVLSEAFLHLAVHGVCVASLLHHCWTFSLRFISGL